MRQNRDITLGEWILVFFILALGGLWIHYIINQALPK